MRELRRWRCPPSPLQTFFSELKQKLHPQLTIVSFSRSRSLLAQEIQQARTYQGSVVERARRQLAQNCQDKKIPRIPEGSTTTNRRDQQKTQRRGRGLEASDAGSPEARRRAHRLSRQSRPQPCGRSGGLRCDRSFGARLARAAAAAEGGAKLKMADKTPGGSQKASSKVIP